MQKLRFSLLLTILCSFIACKYTNTDAREKNFSAIDSTATTNLVVKKDILSVYTWVDKLRLRKAPNTKSDVLKELKEGEVLTFLDEKTKTKDKINIRGTLHNEPWLKVITADQIEGWVYGGGVKFDKPRIDEAPSLYDACFELLHKKRKNAAQKCKKRKQKKVLKSNDRWVEQTAKGYALLLLDGKKVFLENKAVSDSSTQRIEYFYLDYIARMGFHLFEVIKEDTSDYLLINDKSGKETTIWGYPKVAPDYRTLVTASNNPEQGLQIWGYTANGFELLLEHNFDKYDFQLPKWIHDGTIEIHATNRTAVKGDDPKEILTFGIEENTGKWQLQF